MINFGWLWAIVDESDLKPNLTSAQPRAFTCDYTTQVTRTQTNAEQVVKTVHSERKSKSYAPITPALII